MATTATRWVYLFRDGDASQRDLLGGKGANLAEMTNAGLPVPPGFTITTAACNAYLAGGDALPDGLWEQALDGLHEVEQQMGRSFGGDDAAAARLRPQRREVLDAGHDGYDPQSRPLAAIARRTHRRRRATPGSPTTACAA